MNQARRTFLKSAVAAAAASPRRASTASKAALLQGWRLSMNEATSMNADYRKAMEGYGRAGFRYVEPWISKIDEFTEREAPAVAKRVLADNGLTPVCACAQGGIAEPVPEQAKFFDQLRHKLEVCAEVGIPRLVVHSVGREKYTLDDYSSAADRFRKAAEMAQSLGVIVVLEFIRGTQFLGSLSTSVPMVRRVNHPNGRLMLDLFHLWGGFSKFEDLDLLNEGEPEHVHLDDLPAGIPREILTDRDRVPPGDGVIPLTKILRALKQKKYRGALSIELFHPRFQNGDPYEAAVELKRKAEAVLRRV